VLGSGRFGGGGRAGAPALLLSETRPNGSNLPATAPIRTRSEPCQVSEYAAAHRVALKGDLPIGVDKRSVDTWMEVRPRRGLDRL
jgi:hypothetical protein